MVNEKKYAKVIFLCDTIPFKVLKSNNFQGNAKINYSFTALMKFFSFVVSGLKVSRLI